MSMQLLGPSSGGIRRHVAALAENLAHGGSEVLIAGPEHVMDGLDVGAAQIEVVGVPNSISPKKLRSAVQEFRSLRQRLPSPAWDVVHAHGLKAGWVALLSRKPLSGRSVPIVLTLHNVVLDPSSGMGARVQHLLERVLIGRVDHVIAASADIVGHVGVSIPPDKLSYIVPTSAAPRPRRTRAEVRAQLDIADDAVLVVVVSRLHPQKDLPMFIDAWSIVAAQYPEACGIIVGEGPERDALHTLIERAGVGNSLRLVGASDHAVDEMAAGDIVAISSTWEGVPLVAAEAVQLGLPVVSTRVGVVEDLCGDGALLSRVGDAQTFAEHIMEYVSSADRRRQAATINRERGAVIYGAPAMADAVEGVYREVCQ